MPVQPCAKIVPSKRLRLGERVGTAVPPGLCNGAANGSSFLGLPPTSRNA